MLAGICIIRSHTARHDLTKICMAQQVNVKFVDDLDGSEAAGTVSFAIDGRAYEIDLSDDNAARLRDSLASFVAAGRKSGGSGAAGGHSTGSRPRRSGRGLGRTATRSPTAAGLRRPWWTPSRPPTDPGDTRRRDGAKRSGPLAGTSCWSSVVVGRADRNHISSRDQAAVSRGWSHWSRSARTAATRCTVSAAARSKSVLPVGPVGHALHRRRANIQAERGEHHAGDAAGLGVPPREMSRRRSGPRVSQFSGAVAGRWAVGTRR
jgi:hypothetical protein